MKVKFGKLFLALPPIIFVVFYSGGFISQCIYNYTTWQTGGGTLGDGTTPFFPSANIMDCLKSAFHFPYGLYGILICVVLLGVLLLFVMRIGFGEKGRKDQERNFSYSDKGTYGTAGFMTKKELSGILETVSDIRYSNGIILGELDNKIVCLPQNTRLNSHIAVYGSSGSMKSRAFCRNMIFQSVKRGNSMIITDPKSELYESMSEYLREHDYTVRVFNLTDPEHSDSWNCLQEIQGDEIMAQIFADVVIKNTGAGKSDHFWDSSEMNLLKALILYVEQNYPEQKKSIGEVYKLLTLKSEKELNAIFDMLPLSHPAKPPYQIYQQASDSVRTGIIIGLGSRLQVFQNQLICDITSHDEIELTLPGCKKCAYFCIISDQNSTFDFLSALFFNFLFIKLVQYADRNCKDGKLPVAVNIIGDEWPNVGTLTDFCKKLSTIRSRNINMTGICFQSISQLQNRYPQTEWREILGSCDTQIFLGTTDDVTAKFISDRSGDISVNVHSKSKMLGTWRISDYTPEYRETHSLGKRKLLTPDEVLRLPIHEALIIIKGQKILKVNKFDYTHHPEYRKLHAVKASEHIPKWHCKKNDKQESLIQKSKKEKHIVHEQNNAVLIDKETIIEKE